MKPPIRLLDRATKEARERAELAPWASLSSESSGLRYHEGLDPWRTTFERDRDRIVHSTAFRRLMYKTQVFVNSEGDYNRTRLSHSLEVAQVARSMSSVLRLNEVLCESLSLAHDLGHPPFGHRGEWALDTMMKDHGGFRHNAQVLRVVDLLERRTPEFPGLNLSRELRESLLKHETDEYWPEEFGERQKHPLLEGQIVDMADSTAYNKHDLEDGLRAGILSEDSLIEHCSLWREARAITIERHPEFMDQSIDEKLRQERIAGELIGICISDLIQESHTRQVSAGLTCSADARHLDRMLVGHSPEVSKQVAELSRFLHKHFYRHKKLEAFREYARKVLHALWEVYTKDATQLAPWYQRWAEEHGLIVAVCDYMAGMTDRFAEREYERLVGPLPV
ncbi:MAG: dGTPase [Planctomycetota bacterium]|jgi:dGTPase